LSTRRTAALRSSTMRSSSELSAISQQNAMPCARSLAPVGDRSSNRNVVLRSAPIPFASSSTATKGSKRVRENRWKCRESTSRQRR
jgi:hypothetical protein